MMKPFLSRLRASAMELVYPEFANCLGCGEPSGTDVRWLCGECLKKLEECRIDRDRACPRCGAPLKGDICVRCGDWPRDGVNRAAYAFGYQPPVDNIIRNMKYRGVYRLGSFMAADMARLVNELGPDGIDRIVPVPMHPARMRERGKNHAQVIAAALSGETGIPCAEMLIRIKNTRQQAKLTGEERREALKGAFGIREPSEASGKKILLADDVITTGSTVNECARVLRGAGAVRVYACAFAGEAKGGL